MVWDINAIAKKPNVINFIANALEKKDIVLIVTVLVAITKNLIIYLLINSKKMKIINKKKVLLYLALAQKVVAIKIIVNALKVDKNAPLYADVLVVKIMRKSQIIIIKIMTTLNAV